MTKPKTEKQGPAETGPRIVKDPKKPTVEELTKLVETINDKLCEGIGQLILLDGAFQGGIQSKDLVFIEVATRDILQEGAEAMREAVALTYQVEW